MQTKRTNTNEFTVGRMIWINATYFVAGVIVDSQDIVLEAAPIISWSVGKPYGKILDFLRGRKALINHQILDKQGQLW